MAHLIETLQRAEAHCYLYKKEPSDGFETFGRFLLSVVLLIRMLLVELQKLLRPISNVRLVLAQCFYILHK